MWMKKYSHKDVFHLEEGGTLQGIEIAYHTIGDLNATRDNVIWICHALTGNAKVEDWWSGLLGIAGPIDTSEYFVVCANVLGSCYGTTGPLSRNELSGEPYYHDFPFFSIRDIVKAHDLLREHLNINNVYAGIGGSLGGQQILEWSIMKPNLFERIILIATNAQHSPWGIAFNESQRMAIEADVSWLTDEADAGSNGLKAARAAALMSYRNYNAYRLKQSENDDGKLDLFNASLYQRYQGDKLASRFNAYSYYYLSKAMDTHNVGRGRGGVKIALNTVKAKALIIGVTSDILFPSSEQVFLRNHIRDAELKLIDSDFGHDGFLVETAAIGEVVKEFLSPFIEGGGCENLKMKKYI